jgi:hypothetical protein
MPTRPLALYKRTTMDDTARDCFSIYEDTFPLFSRDLLGTNDDSAPMPSATTNELHVTGKPVTRHPDQVVALSTLAFLDQLNWVRKSSFAMPAQFNGLASLGAP